MFGKSKKEDDEKAEGDEAGEEKTDNDKEGGKEAG
jgi:hypothetical protein